MQLGYDLKQALRGLRRGRGFTWAALVMLALGIGATTALFSVVNGVLLSPLGFHDPGQLMLLGEAIPQLPADSAKFAYFVTPAAFLAWQKQATDFSAVAAIGPSSLTLAPPGARPQLLHGAHVSPNFFSMLGVRPELGRLLAPGDARSTARPMVLTDALWRSAFHADPAIIGRHLDAPGTDATVIGVLPPSFRLAGRELGPMLDGEPTQYFDALKFRTGELANLAQDVFSDFNYSVIGRLRPGATREQAIAQSNVILTNLARTAPDKLSLTTLMAPVRDYAVGPVRQQLWLLLGAVLAVLLIVCVNLGGLWLARLADRRRDFAIRTALGAAPSRLARQALLQSVLLGVAGGVAGIICAALALPALVAAAPAGTPRLGAVHLDWRVLLFGLALSLLAGLLTGCIPAWKLGRSDPQSSLKAAGGASTADHASLRSRQSLIAVQAALATLLLAAAGLLGLSLYRLLGQATGFQATHAVVATITLNPYADPQRDQILTQLSTAATALPGVRSSGLTSHLPLQGETWVDGIGVPGRTYPGGQQPTANVRFVSPGYLRAAGIPLLAGRDLAPSDRPQGWPPKSEAAEVAMPEKVVVSAAAVRLLWPGLAPGDAIGRKIVYNGQIQPQIVGVAADVRTSFTALPPAVVYQPYWEQLPYQAALVIRTPLPLAAVATPLRTLIRRIAPQAPITRLEPLGALATAATANQRYQFLLLLVFALLALLLAALGVYAMVAHSVARRAKDLAIRMALGASAGDLWGLVLRQALVPVVAGAVGGVVAALALGRLLAALLFQVSPASPGVLAGVALAVVAAAVVACIAPARRACSTDPLAALRAE